MRSRLWRCELRCSAAGLDRVHSSKPRLNMFASQFYNFVFQLGSYTPPTHSPHIDAAPRTCDVGTYSRIDQDN